MEISNYGWAVNAKFFEGRAGRKAPKTTCHEGARGRIALMTEESRRPSSLAFIGPRGAGKSKLSRKFGRRVDMPVFSTDTLVSYEAGGRSIPRLVAEEGWASFREREAAILKKLSGMRHIVLDCGGGILVEAPAAEGAPETFSENKATLLRSCSRIVYIKRSMDWLLEKVKDDSSRPSLSAARAYEEILRRRLPWYEQTADFILEMGDHSIEEAIGIVLARFPGFVEQEAGRPL